MLRILAALSVVMMLVSAFALHAINYQTRQLEQTLRTKEILRDQIVEEIAILKADQAFLARPVRIEAAARQLGMRPADVDQLPRYKAGGR